jgi:hypothetical protein
MGSGTRQDIMAGRDDRKKDRRKKDHSKKADNEKREDAMKLRVESLVPEEPRVYPLPPDSPEFAEALLAKPGHVQRLTELHPYCLVLVNDTPSDIIAFSVRWSGKEGDRNLFSGILKHNFNSDIPGSPPGRLYPSVQIHSSSTRFHGTSGSRNRWKIH